MQVTPAELKELLNILSDGDAKTLDIVDIKPRNKHLALELNCLTGFEFVGNPTVTDGEITEGEAVFIVRCPVAKLNLTGVERALEIFKSERSKGSTRLTSDRMKP